MPRDALERRKIPVAWLERALISSHSEPDATDVALEHRLVIIPEYGNRTLRVVVNARVKPIKVVTLFFDRRLKGTP